MKEKLLEKLEIQIHNVIMETAREPRIIVMHPQTWQDLTQEVTEAIDPNMRYRGIKVLRSSDLGEGEFQM